MDLRDIFATNLRRVRHGKGLSQDDLAYSAKLSRSYLSQIEKGKPYASLRIIGRLADRLGVEPAELLKLCARGSVSPSPQWVMKNLKPRLPNRAEMTTKRILKSTKKIDDKLLDPEHLEWLVNNRAATQHTSVKLFRLLKAHPTELEGGDFASPAQMLVAISFALWRSAFLSDKTGFLKDTNKDAFTFLGEMVLTNAIVFSNERNTKNWTFNFYAGGAFYRLQELTRTWVEFKPSPLHPPLGSRTPKNRWAVLQKAFEKAVDHFEQRLNAPKRVRRIKRRRARRLFLKAPGLSKQ